MRLPVVTCLCLLTALGSAARTTATTERLDPPEAWGLGRAFSQTLPSDDRWWQQFNDSILNSLILRAESSNFNIRTALHRMEVARLTIGQTRAGYFPTVALSAGYALERSSGAMTSPAMHTRAVNYADIGASARWEIDLFGRIREQVNSDKASARLSKADYDAAMVSLCSSLAKAYVHLRVLQAQYDLAIDHTHSQEEIVSMTLARQDAGLADALEVAQARQVLYSTRSGIPPLEAEIHSAIGTIAVLAGCYPDEITPLLEEPRPLPGFDFTPCVGTPMEMLRRRPDVAQAEAQIDMYAAQLGIARKEYLPSLSLTGTIGTQAHRGRDLFTTDGLTYSVVPTLSWTLFDGMARRQRTAIARTQMEMGIDTYNQTLLGAVQEVDTYAADYQAYLQQISILDRLVDESRTAFNLSVDLYRSTLTPFSNVMDAQMNLLAYQTEALTARGNALTSLISLYQALGGGW